LTRFPHDRREQTRLVIRLLAGGAFRKTDAKKWKAALDKAHVHLA
jgi:hypothetical protein